ncbi:MAG: hypothetical protein IMW89_03930, partial [Ktedonobacteraceae bacterium]|nr:hypothetical protein [Ktedonobacteraceae bacterium]
MWYQDPRQARRAAREARRQAKYAYRAAWRANRYRYGRPGGGIVGVLVLLFLLLFWLSHAWGWLIAGIVIALLAVILLRVLSAGGSPWISGQQMPQESYP